MFDTSEFHINSSLDTFSNSVNPTGNYSVNFLLPDLTGFGSKQLLMLAGEIIIDAWQYQTNQNQALVYAAGSIFNQEFVTNAQVAFGKDFDISKAEALGADVLGGNYGVLPDVQFLFDSEMNGALGAYAKSTNTIYFNSDFLTQNADDPTAVGKVLVEETGHFLDAYASPVDSPGDEGEILAGLITGKIFNQTELFILKAEDDSSVFTINSKSVAVELASRTGQTNTDVDGDGKSDAIVSNNDGIYVRRSNGTNFLPNEKWTEIGYGGTQGTFFADVTGDGRADAIVSNADGIYVRRSDGTKFLPNEKWTEIGYGGTQGTFFADVTGDGRADAIVSNADGIYVRRASSDGTRFLPNEKWTEIGYGGTQGTFFADVTGDGKADAIVSNDNWVTVRRSTGTGFSGNERWTDIGYGGTQGAWYTDVTGDGKADAIVSNADGIYVRRSIGTSFSGNEKWTDIGYGGTQGTFFGDVTGDGKADAIVSNDNWVTVRRSTGAWFSGNERWTDIGYGGTQGTFIGNTSFTPPKSPSGLMTTSTNLTKLINGQLNGTYIDVDKADGAQCWDLVAYATGINGSSSYWNANNWKAAENVMANGNVAVGAAIATFLGPNGSYYSSSGNHTAIFAGYGSENGVSGFYVWDQNWNLNGNLAIKKHFVANNKSGTSDADNYYLIRV